MKKYCSICLAAIFFVTINLTGCSNHVSGDAAIKAEVEKTLQSDPSGTGVTVDVKEGVVTLSGNCTNDKAKELCTMRTETVLHVKSVVNNCTVPQNEMTDEELIRKLWEVSKDYTTIKIGAMNGVVAIAGNLSKQQWKDLKTGIDKLKPKGYDTASLRIE